MNNLTSVEADLQQKEVIETTQPQPPKVKKVWQKPEMFILDNGDINAKAFNSKVEATAPGGGHAVSSYIS